MNGTALPDDILARFRRSPTKLRLLMVLADIVDHTTATATVRNQDLMARIGSNVRSLQRILVELESAGIVARPNVHQSDGTRRIRLLWLDSGQNDSRGGRAPQPPPQPSPLTYAGASHSSINVNEIQNVNVSREGIEDGTGAETRPTRRPLPALQRALALAAQRERDASPTLTPADVPPEPAITAEVETARTLGAAPRPPAPIDSGPLLTSTLIGRLADPTAGPDDADELAIRLAADFNDPASIGYYRQTCRQVLHGTLRPRILSQAYTLSRSPSARFPPRIFASHIRAALSTSTRSSPTHAPSTRNEARR